MYPRAHNAGGNTQNVRRLNAGAFAHVNKVHGVPLFLGGGATGDNVRELLQEYDAVCVATWIKNGDMRNPVDPDRTRYFMEQAALAEVGT